MIYILLEISVVQNFTTRGLRLILSFSNNCLCTPLDQILFWINKDIFYQLGPKLSFKPCPKMLRPKLWPPERKLEKFFLKFGEKNKNRHL